MRDRPLRKPRYVRTDDAAVIEAIQRADLCDPVGGCVEGVWWVDVESLRQWREANERGI